MPLMTEQQKEELAADLVAVAQGSRPAFDRIYRAQAALVYGVVMRMVRDRAQADEIYQEVFVKIWRSAGSFDRNRASPKSWIVAIARNAAIDHIRRNGRAPQTEEVTEFNAGTTASTETEALARDTARQLEACLSELDDQKQFAIRKVYLDGYSYEELAVVLELPLNTLKSWLRRSLLRLRACMEGE